VYDINVYKRHDTEIFAASLAAAARFNFGSSSFTLHVLGKKAWPFRSSRG
jgi:hypothetical protein